MRTIALLTCLACALLAGAFAVIPPYIKICHRKDPDINNCVSSSIDGLRSKLAEGIPDLGVPPIEPLLLKNIYLSRGPNGANFNVNLTDIYVTGPSTFKVLNLKVDVEKLLFTYRIKFAKLEFRGKYQINTRILLLELKGEGDITGTFNDWDCYTIMKANKITKNNGTYLKFDKMKFDLKIGKASIQLHNLFNGDPTLGPATNDVINQNSDLFLDEIKPILQETLENFFTDVANKITDAFTYEELFPDN